MDPNAVGVKPEAPRQIIGTGSLLQLPQQRKDARAGGLRKATCGREREVHHTQLCIARLCKR